jgi:pimeloyl-ACP methyl ester carboxylesterase
MRHRSLREATVPGEASTYKRWVPAVFACALALVLGLGTGTAADAAGKAKVSWSRCYQEFGSYECGAVRVPLDYDSPKGASISIAMIRLPATDPGRRIGSLFLNPGGPGGSGVDFALFAGPLLYSDEVRARFDLVGFDPRGIARSAPLRCFGNEKQWEPYFTPFAFPRTPGEEAMWAAADRYLISACDRRGGAIAEHMSTANVARDLDLLRQAVGDERLTYAGYSYGSFLGVTYANLFPDNVRALVVDGVLDPVAWTTGAGGEGDAVPFSTRLRSDAGARETLDEFFRLCDAGTCAFGPDSEERFRALAEELKEAPLSVKLPDGTTELVDYPDLVAMTLTALYDSSSWEGYARLLADMDSQRNLARIGVRVRSYLHRPLFVAEQGYRRYPNLVEGFPGVACSDSDNPSSYDVWSDAGAEADAEFGYFGRIWTWASSLCAEWYAADRDRYTGPFTAKTANPVLVVGTRFDPATRYEGAVAVAGLLPNSRLLTVNGWGHTSLFISSCADQVVSRYLLAVVTPPPGTSCDQSFTPFGG